MKILIVDDETLARERLVNLLADLNIDCQTSQAKHGVNAIKIAKEVTPDLVLLDIRMPLMDGIEVAQHLNKLESPPAIIFVTAYQDYALDAFDVQAVDYLMKPVRKENLQQALNKAKKLNKTNINALIGNKVSNSRTHLSTVFNGELQIIAVEDIYFLKANQKYVTAFWPQGELLISDSLKSLEREFATQFIRIHRNTLVALKYIRSLGKDDQGLTFIGLKDMKIHLPISRRHLKVVRNTLKYL